MNAGLDKRRARTSGGELAYLEAGDGEPVLLLHGFHLSSYLWRGLVPLLATRFRVIAPDLLGCGDSEKPETAPLDITAQAGYVRELIGQLGIGTYAVAAHGPGGGVGQLLAIDSDAVRAMVLVDSVVFDALPTPELRALADLEAAQRTSHLMEVAIPTAFDLGMRRRDRLADEALQEYLRPWIAQGGVAAYFRAAEESTSRVLLDRAPELSALEIPVLLLWGEEDPFFPVAMAERLQEAMPTASLALLPGCGHFLPEEATETIGPLMFEWLRARYLGEGHEHPEPAGPIAISLGRRPPIEQEFLGEFTPDEGEDEIEEAHGHEEGSA